MLRKYWIHFVIVTVIVSLISIKGFPLAFRRFILATTVQNCTTSA